MRTSAFLASGLAATCLAVTGSVVWKLRPPPNQISHLTAAYRQQPGTRLRLRLTAFPYVPAEPTIRDVSASEAPVQAVAYRAVADSTDAREVAIGHLLLGRQRDAVGVLEAAVGRDGSRADLWNDLAVGLHELGRLGDDPELLVRALAATDTASRLSPSMPEPIFNRAAVLDSLALPNAAARVRAQYLAIDGHSRWAEDTRAALARERADRLARRRWQTERPRLRAAALRQDLETVDSILRAFPLEARTWCEREVLFQWARAEAEQRYADASQALTVAEITSGRLRTMHGEGLVQAAARAIRTAIDTNETAPLVSAYTAYDQARRLLSERRPTEATPFLTEAERDFARGGSPMALVARYYRAAAMFDRRHTEEAIALLDDVEAKAEQQFQSLRAHCLWERSRILGRLGKRYESLQLAVRAAEQFRRIGEVILAGRNEIEIASRLTWLGRSAEAWRLRREIFKTAAANDAGETLLHSAMYTAARDELSMGRHDIARSFFLLFLPIPGESPLMRFDALLWQTYLELQHGDGADLAPRLLELRASVAKIRDPALAAEANDQMTSAEALLVRRRSPARAVELLTDAIEFRRSAGRLSRLAESYLERGRAYADLQQYDMAQRDFAAALATMEEQRTEIRPLDLRDTFFDVARGTCEELLKLQFERRALTESFHTVERCRARSLLDGVGRQQAAPLHHSEVRRRLRDTTVIASYASLGKTTLLLVSSSAGLEAFSVDHHPGELAVRTAEFVSAIERNDSAAHHRHARALYDLLVGPYEHRLGSATRLVIVSDETVAAMPFAVLEDGERRRLIERVEITCAPSASIYTQRFANGSSPLPADARVLAVADPAFSRAAGVDLPPLRFARREAAKVAQFHRRTTTLMGEAATADRFLEELVNADLVHVATHAVVNSRAAASSFILLAPGRRDSGVVYLSTIAALRLGRSPVVVLAGCRTAIAGPGAGAIRSLTAAFLAAGAAGVAGTLWSVEDEVTEWFSTALHHHLRHGKQLSAAVRAAQLDMIGSNDPRLRQPSSWASFVAFGN